MTLETTAQGRPTIDKRRVAELTEREMQKLAERTPQSKQRYERGGQGDARRRAVAPSRSTSRGRSTSSAARAPASGTSTATSTSTSTTASASCASATRTRRSATRSRRGSTSAPTSPLPPTARSSSPRSSPRRFGLPQWRFTNSGTESTMDAVHLARGVTGRDVILKIEGSYHGHHDAVMVSGLPAARGARRARRPALGPLRRRLPARADRAHPGGPVQRRRRARAASSTSSRARSPG